MSEVLPVKMSLGAMLRLGEETRSQTKSVIELAQWFVDHEIAIVPTKDKRPIGGVQEGKLSTEGITDQYGIILGNGIIGIDFDEYHGAEGLGLFGVTRRWQSGSGKGYGILFKVPSELSQHGFKLSPGIDVRGTNQILVGPGSRHPSGGTYTLIQDIEIADAPEWLIHVLKKKSEEVDSNEIELGEETRPEWLFNDKRYTAKFETNDLSDRSGRTWELVSYSTERGASNEELSWIIRNFKPAVDKGNLQEELPRLIKKVRLLHEHPGSPCDSAGCKNPPDWMTKAVKLAFWDARPEFAYIKQAAESRLVPPKAVMVAVLCRLAASIPTEIVLPPIIGTKASLNFFACFVGASSDGKGTSTKLAEQLFDFKQTGMVVTGSTPGSGEGVVSTYLKIKDNSWKQTVESALVNFDEIDNLKASSDRQGSTLSAILRQAFMGEQIGGTYSRAVKELLPHSYRMALQLSAQPLRSAGLLEDSDGGLPQRFVFVQTTNPESPNVDNLPEFPVALEWRVPKALLDLKEVKQVATKPREIMGQLDIPKEYEKKYIELEIDPVIVREIKINRIERLRKGSAGINGHEDLVCLKVASLLAILDGRLNVTIKDMQLAKIIMSWSKQVLSEIKETLSHKKLKDDMARTTVRMNQAVAIENKLSDSAIERVASNIIRWAEKGFVNLKGEQGFRLKIKASDRTLISEALEWLETNNKEMYEKLSLN